MRSAARLEGFGDEIDEMGFVGDGVRGRPMKFLAGAETPYKNINPDTAI